MSSGSRRFPLKGVATGQLRKRLLPRMWAGVTVACLVLNLGAPAIILGADRPAEEGRASDSGQTPPSEPNSMRLLVAYAAHRLDERGEAGGTVSAAATPNDTFYLTQQLALPKISWDQAYGVISIPGSATIAVLDTGVEATHPDLAGRMVPGTTFVGGDPNTDSTGHGTRLAGIAAATVNNGIGIAGVAYAGASISSVKVSTDGTFNLLTVAQGVQWAADNGAKVILMGFVGSSYSQTLADAVAYAWGKGAVLVAPAGSTAPTYPAGLPNVIGVAATDLTDGILTGTFTGSAAVAAPGLGIYTTLTGGLYGLYNGTTSAPAAQVAGLATGFSQPAPGLTSLGQRWY